MADLSSLLQLGQQMQFRLSEIQSQLAQQTVTCSAGGGMRSEEHTSELQSQSNLVCRPLLEKNQPRVEPRPRLRALSHSLRPHAVAGLIAVSRRPASACPRSLPIVRARTHAARRTFALSCS